MTITQKFENDLIKASEALEKQKEQGKNYFNIFDALGVSYKENYHSAFIAYLLDTNSEHYQRVFTELFLAKLNKDKTIPSKVFGNLSVEKLQSVKIEASTKQIKQNRRIDILLQFDNFVNIIIENKISAKDQSAQIKDYVSDISKSKNCTPNKILVIYLNPSEKDPSEMSFGKTSTRKQKYWYLDKDGQYSIIRDENDQMRAYYFQMSYKWIKSWLESCIKELEKQAKGKARGDSNTRGENGLNKIIFGLNQYIEILEWYITDEFKENDPVAKFITQDNKNQKMALEIIKDKKHDLHEMLTDSWDKISESIVEKFYDDLLKDFQKGTKIGKDIYKADSAYNEIGKTGWQMVFYKKAREKLEFDYFIILADEKTKFAKPYFMYGTAYGEKHKNIANECKKFFFEGKGDHKNGVKQSKECFYKYIFDEKDTQEYAFVKWIIEQNGNAVAEFKAKLSEFAQLEIIQKTMKDVEKYINEHL